MLTTDTIKYFLHGSFELFLTIPNINEIKDRANNMYGDIITILYKIFSNI